MGDARKWAVRLLPVLVPAAAAVLLLAPLPDRWTRGWRGSLIDFGHVPLFAVLVLAWSRPGRSPVWPALLAVGAAGAVELVQGAAGRSPGWGDFGRGVLGAAAAAAGLQARRTRGGRAAGYGLLAAGLAAWPVIDVAPGLLDAAEGYSVFPVLADFRTPRELARWECQQAVLTRVPDPADPGRWAGRLDLLPGPHPYPSGILTPVTGDFREYRRLCCEFEVEGGPAAVVLSVRTGAGREGATTHYQVGRVYAPGPHTVRIDLSAVAPLGEEGPLDLSDVRAVQLFAVRLAEPRALVVRRVWLEPGPPPQ
jgi:hypothetical protein